jgi:hypothetical protein
MGAEACTSSMGRDMAVHGILDDIPRCSFIYAINPIVLLRLNGALHSFSIESFPFCSFNTTAIRRKFAMCHIEYKL